MMGEMRCNGDDPPFMVTSRGSDSGNGSGHCVANITVVVNVVVIMMSGGGE